MTQNDSFRRYIDAGVAFTALTRKKAEELVAELVDSGDVQRSEARARVDELIERSRKGTEVIVQTVRAEVSSQLDNLGITNLEELAVQVADLLNRGAETVAAATKRPTSSSRTSGKKAASGTAAKKTSPKKTSAKKTSPKKTSARKTTAKKTAAKKTTAKKTAAKKTTAKKTASKQAPSASGSTDGG